MEAKDLTDVVDELENKTDDYGRLDDNDRVEITVEYETDAGNTRTRTGEIWAVEEGAAWGGKKVRFSNGQGKDEDPYYVELTAIGPILMSVTETSENELGEVTDSSVKMESKGKAVMTDGGANEIKTGTEKDSDVTTENADIFAYADDGEYATVWEIDRISSSIVRVNYYRCEAGLSEHDTQETFEIDPEKTTEEWAKECAEANPEEAVKVARDYWN